MKKFNRRNLLKTSLGTAAAGMAGSSLLSAFSRRALAADTPFKRLIVWYTPEGCSQKAFWPRQFGDININPSATVNNMQMRQPTTTDVRSFDDDGAATFCLQPLADHITDINLYSGFRNQGDSGKDDDHHHGITNSLTGGNYRNGSLDQVVANAWKGQATIDSLYLPVYGNHPISAGPGNSYLSPVRDLNGNTIGKYPHWNPMQGYMELFNNGIPAPNNSGPVELKYSDRNSRVAILEAAAAQIDAVKCIGGEAARHKMELLLASYESIEKQTQSLLDADANPINTADVRFDIPSGWTNVQGGFRDTSRYWNKPENFGKMVDIAIDTTVAALALDRTRVSLMQFSASGGDKGGPANGQHYTYLDIPGFEGNRNTERHDHAMGHSSGSAELRRDQARVFRWYYGRLAYLIQRLKDIPDGAGSLFDSTLIVTASEFSTYDHKFDLMPYMSIGNLGGTLQTGQHFDGRKGSAMRHQGELFYGYTKALGLNLDQFGQASNAYTPWA